MKDWTTLSDTSENEALNNELKGNLFEFLVAKELATFGGVLGDFYINLDETLKLRLMEYELWIREHFKNWELSLPELAKQTSQKIIEYFKYERPCKIRLIGKSYEKQFFDYEEGDLIISFGKKEFPVSLKLCKYGSYVNTKSAGIKSFFNKYFFDNFGKLAEQAQARFNQNYDFSHIAMARELHELADLDFLGNFDQRWISHGLPELPGKLELPFKKRLHEHYYRTISLLYDETLDFYKKDNQIFKRSLISLLGFSRNDLVQVKCFHAIKDECIELKSIELLDFKMLDEKLGSFEIIPLKENISSFEISFLDHVFQIRVKPMNKFTVPAMKVNCSLRSL